MKMLLLQFHLNLRLYSYFAAIISVIYKKKLDLHYIANRTVDFYYNFYIDVICFTAERKKRSLPPGKN